MEDGGRHSTLGGGSNGKVRFLRFSKIFSLPGQEHFFLFFSFFLKRRSILDGKPGGGASESLQPAVRKAEALGRD